MVLLLYLSGQCTASDNFTIPFCFLLSLLLGKKKKKHHLADRQFIGLVTSSPLSPHIPGKGHDLLSCMPHGNYSKYSITLLKLFFPPLFLAEGLLPLILRKLLQLQPGVTTCLVRAGPLFLNPTMASAQSRAHNQ